MSQGKDLDDSIIQFVRLGLAMRVAEKALQVIGKEHGATRLATLEQQFIADAKNMDIEGVPPVEEARIYEEAIKIITGTFAIARERLAAG